MFCNNLRSEFTMVGKDSIRPKSQGILYCTVHMDITGVSLENILTSTCRWTNEFIYQRWATRECLELYCCLLDHLCWRKHHGYKPSYWIPCSDQYLDEAVQYSLSRGANHLSRRMWLPTGRVLDEVVRGGEESMLFRLDFLPQPAPNYSVFKHPHLHVTGSQEIFNG